MFVWWLNLETTFTVLSQYSFFVQFIITLVVTLYLYTKYKKDWLKFEQFFFAFFVFITTSNFIAIFFIATQGLSYASVIILSNLALVLLLMAGETLMEVRNKLFLYFIPLLIFVIDTSVNVLYALNDIGEITYRIITGIDILLFTIPSVIIYAYLTYKTKDISLGFFVLALLLYITGGFSLSRYTEVSMAIFYILAVICFAIATILPVIRNRLQNQSPTSS